jgi:hypothetical protein
MPETELAPRHALKRTRPVLPIAAIALAAIVGGAFWLWPGGETRAPAPAPASAPPVDAPAAAAPEGAAAQGAAAAHEAPVTPADLRALLERASADGAFRRWLGEADLLERWAAIAENLATGASPRAHLPFLRLAAPFSVEQRGAFSVIAPASYRRYDTFADAVATVDARALARAYRAVHPALETAYGALGYPRGGLDVATAKALRRLLGAPVVESEIFVVDEGGIHVFEDPALERLGEVDKHLLRMGPRNTRLVQAKAREILEALGLPAETAAR